MEEEIITASYLHTHPNEIFVFGDNLQRRGRGGAASLRDEPNTYGFITKKVPNSQATAFYFPDEYRYIYEKEIAKLRNKISTDPHHVYLISKLGAGLANKYHIFEEVIEPQIKYDLLLYKNVRFLW